MKLTVRTTEEEDLKLQELCEVLGMNKNKSICWMIRNIQTIESKYKSTLEELHRVERDLSITKNNVRALLSNEEQRKAIKNNLKEILEG